MNLTFSVSEPQILAMTKQYYSDSVYHQRLRSRSRWTLPILLLPVMVLFTIQFGFSWSSTAVFLIGMIGGFVIAPKRFDAQVKRYAIQQMQESSYPKSFGKYEITIDEKNLVSHGPTGYTEYHWDAVDRAILTDDYLFIFLSGPTGFPIQITEVGTDVAKKARAEIESLIARAK